MSLNRSTRRHGTRIRQFGWVAAAGMILVAALAPSAAAAHITWATVTGHAEGSAANNNVEAWGDDCTKLDGANLGSTYLLSKNYELVIVKAGSESSAPGYVNTLFADASAGETVWADSDGSGSYSEDDKGISHIIFCGPSETTTTTTESETTDTETTDTETTETESETTTETTNSSTGGELGVVGTPGVTPPPTDAVGATSQAANVDGFRMVLVGLAALLAVSLLFVQPKKVAKEGTTQR